MDFSLTIVIVAITVLVSWRAFKDTGLYERLIMWPPAIERGKQYDRLLTHGFIHAGWMHLLFNMITLWSFGTPVERVFSGMITPVGYVLFYLSAIVVAVLPTFIRHRRDAHYASLGASGGVCAVVFAYVLFDPWSKLIIFPIPIPMPAILFAVLFVVYSIWMDRQGGGKKNHSAHLWGAAYGVLFTVLLYPQVLDNFTPALFGSESP